MCKGRGSGSLFHTRKSAGLNKSPASSNECGLTGFLDSLRWWKRYFSMNQHTIRSIGKHKKEKSAGTGFHFLPRMNNIFRFQLLRERLFCFRRSSRSSFRGIFSSSRKEESVCLSPADLHLSYLSVWLTPASVIPVIITHKKGTPLVTTLQQVSRLLWITRQTFPKNQGSTAGANLSRRKS